MVRSLKAIAHDVFLERNVLCSRDLDSMRRQYEDLHSSLYGLKISFEAASYMSRNMCRMLTIMGDGIRTLYTVITDYCSPIAPYSDFDHLLLLKELLGRSVLKQLDHFHLGFFDLKLHLSMHAILRDEYSYPGHVFKSLYSQQKTAHDLICCIQRFPPLVDYRMRDLLVAKTSKIVATENDLWSDRYMFAKSYVDSVNRQSYILTQLEHLVDFQPINQPLDLYRATLLSELDRLLTVIKRSDDSWLHDLASNPFM